MPSGKTSSRAPVTVEGLKAAYNERREAIKEKLAEFRTVGETGDDIKLFEELVFCIFTAGASARMGLKCIERVRSVLLSGDENTVYNAIAGAHIYARDRAKYIVHTRNFLQDHCGLRMREKLDSFQDPLARRDFFATTRDIKGIGFKESSHFLRNIGYCGYAILDKHVLRSMQELGVIEDAKPPNNRTQYLALEGLLKNLATQLEIDFDELDLVLWSSKTGEILK